MKNLTEFSGVILRRGAKVRADKLAALKAAAQSAAPAEAPAEAPAADAPAEAAAEAPAADAPAEAAAEAPAADAPAKAAADAPAEAAAEAPAEAAAEAPAEAAAEAPAEAEAEAKPKAPQVDEEALAAAVAEEMGFSEDRTKYLLGALKAVGRKGVDQVRNVRVFQGEEGPKGSFSIDDLHFVVDRIVVASKGGAKDDRKGRGGKGKGRDGKGRGGQGKGGSPGGGRPSGGKGGGGFDVMAKDEKIGDVPSGGLGWSLARKPGSDPKDGRKPGRKGPRRGKPGEKPGNNRNRNRNRKGGAGGRKPPMPEVTVKAPIQTAPAAKIEAPKAPEAKPAPAPAAAAVEETK